MSFLTFAKTALGSMVKQPVTVCYPQEKLTAPERLRGCVHLLWHVRAALPGGRARGRSQGRNVVDRPVCLRGVRRVHRKLPQTLPDYGHRPYPSRSGQDSHGGNQAGIALKWGWNSAGMGPAGQKCPAGPARERAVVPPRTKLCRITGLDSEPPTIRKIPKTKPQVDSLPFFKK